MPDTRYLIACRRHLLRDHLGAAGSAVHRPDTSAIEQCRAVPQHPHACRRDGDPLSVFAGTAVCLALSSARFAP